MQSFSTQSINDSDEYMKAPYEAYVLTAIGKIKMKRTGITPPGYPTRAVYQAGKYESGKPCYVFEGGHFWLSGEWREQCRADGRFPAPSIMQPQKKRRKK